MEKQQELFSSPSRSGGALVRRRHCASQGPFGLVQSQYRRRIGFISITKKPCHVGLDSVLMRCTSFIIAVHRCSSRPVSNSQVRRPRGIFLTGCSLLTDYADMVAISSRELASINYHIGAATCTVSLAVESGSLRKTATRVYSTLSLRV